MMTSSMLVRLSLGALLVALASGCGDKRQAEVTPVNAATAQGARPEVLTRASDEIRAGQAAAAQGRLQTWLSGNAGHPCRAEAHYLLGQALSAQGQFEAAKKSHDQAIDLTKDRTLKALAMLGRADCNYEMKKYHLASRQYHWLEEMYRDVTAVNHAEVLFKLGLCAKFAGFQETADYWFDRVIELYATSEFAAEARREHTKLGPAETGEPKFYYLEVASYGEEKLALTEAEAFRAKGYADVRVEPISMMGTKYYSVRIGKFANRMDAKRAMEDAEMSGLSASIRPGYFNIPK